MTDKRQTRIRQIAKARGINRRAAATVLDAGRARSPIGKSEPAATEPLTLDQVVAAVHDLFAENRLGTAFTTQVNSLRLPGPYFPGGPVPEVPLTSVTFGRTEVGWTLIGSLVLVDGEVYDGRDKFDAGWLETVSGRDRVHRSLRAEIQGKYRPLTPVLADLQVHGARAKSSNILLDVTLTFQHPLYALLGRLRAPSTFSVATGRVPAVGRSASLEAAVEQSRRLAIDPQWYAETGSVQTTVTRAEHQLLVTSGAAEYGQVQVIRSFHNEQRMTFAGACTNCRRWISCGDGERQGACVCGQKYRVTFDLPPVRHWTLHHGPCCMDCGTEMAMREWVGPRQPWKVVNEAQVQCRDCQVKKHAREDVQDAAKRLGEVQARVLRTQPVVSEPEKTDLKELAALDDANTGYREALEMEQLTRYTIEEAEHRRDGARSRLEGGDFVNAAFYAERGLAVLDRLLAEGETGPALARLRKELEAVREDVRRHPRA